MKFQNPIVPGFSPDPSVLLFEDTYFLVTSSFHIFPALPIYISKDLNAWTHFANAIDRPSQLDLTNATTTNSPEHPNGSMITTAGLFAPTIRFHNGTFYIICTNTKNTGTGFETENFYITCSNIWENNWSDPVYIDFSGIDPSLFFEDNRAYVQGSFRLHPLKQDSCTIKQFEIDIATGKQLSEMKEIWEGFAKIHSEGPHIYKKDEWYYLLIAEGGTFEHHMLSIARSRDIWGPYIPYEQNPILTADGTSEYIQGVGHGELFQDLEGRWWAAVLGVRDTAGTFPLGRETFLTPVSWPENEWPKVQQPRIQFERNHSTSPKSLSQKPKERVSDCYIRTPIVENYNFSSNRRIFSISASKADLSAQTGTVSFLGERQRQPTCTSTVKLQIRKEYAGQFLKAGLALFKDDPRHGEIYYDYSSSTVMLSASLRGPSKVLNSHGPGETWESLEFRIQANTENYMFYYRANGIGSWVLLGTIHSKEMTARDFTGTLMGVFATGQKGGEHSIVEFEDFEVHSELGETS